ncbi:MAG: hypothetical protein EZS28_018578 [Streblomastix strix]|uniref:Uncharacterized protein n=1 Tax=Streblomastix strix TaxID=222440 RepID=A0A5J4VTG4_9EUKA|nr:MAG: hypothetical protein EZS28_018578 [Streblomastix strix]
MRYSLLIIFFILFVRGQVRQDTQIFFEDYEITVDDYLSLDIIKKVEAESKTEKFVHINNIKWLGEKDEKTRNYTCIPREDFKNLEMSKYHKFDSSKCIGVFRGIKSADYALLGYALYAYAQIDIAPSVVYAIESLPLYYRYGAEDLQFNTQLEGCNMTMNHTRLSFQLEGVVSRDCISNEAKMKGYLDDSTATTPAKPTLCDDGTTEIEKQFEGLKFGHFYTTNQTLLKKYIVRTGPIFATFQHKIKNNPNPQQSTALIIGWEKYQDEEDWIVIVGEDQIVENGTETYWDHRFLLDVLPFNQPDRELLNVYGEIILSKEASEVEELEEKKQTEEEGDDEDQDKEEEKDDEKEEEVVDKEDDQSDAGSNIRMLWGLVTLVVLMPILTF